LLKNSSKNSPRLSATEIRLKSKTAGLALIRIIDNGHGHSRLDDLPPRHSPPTAPSSCPTDEDLFNITAHMGFPGEALASIGSVSPTRNPLWRTDSQSAYENL